MNREIDEAEEAQAERRRRLQRIADAGEEHRRRQDKLLVEARKLEGSREQVEVVEVDAEGRAKLGRTYDAQGGEGVAQFEGGYRRRGPVHEYDPMAGLGAGGAKSEGD